MTAKRQRLVIFCSYAFYVSNILVDKFLSAAATNLEIEDCVVVVTDKVSRARVGVLRFVRWHLNELIIKLFNPGHKWRLRRYFWESIEDVAKRHRRKVVFPDSFDINSVLFMKWLDQWRPTVGLSLGCTQIFRPEVIKRFKALVNYHNSLLPYYKGVYSTEWSLYSGETQTGYTYHLIDHSLDTGPIVKQGRIAVNSAQSTESHEIEKTIRAAQDAQEIISDLCRPDSMERHPQIGGTGSYYGFNHFRDITNITPEKISSIDLLRRLKIFGHVDIKLRNGILKNVTDIVEIQESNKKTNCSIITSDRRIFEIRKVGYLPLLKKL